jgi:N-acetylmuramoyl-L-alanine amidase CwlD
MRSGLTFLALLFLLAGCASTAMIPPQRVTKDNPEPRTIMLSEMAKRMGWEWGTGDGAGEWRMRSPKGDRMVFFAGRDEVLVNDQPWRFERDAIVRFHDLMLPESVFDWAARHFGRHDLLVNRGTDRVEYEFEPLTPPARPAPKPTDAPKSTGAALKGMTICVDAGHGGKDPGGMANDVRESEITLSVALKLEKLLKAQGAKVLMTRTDDSYPELDARCDLANRNKADLFISIHANIASDTGVSGFEAFYNPDSPEGARFTRALVEAMDKSSDAPNRGAKKDPRGLRVLLKTTMPASLVELGFMSNAAEARRLMKADYQDTMAKALCDGVVAYAKATAGKASVSR